MFHELINYLESLSYAGTGGVEVIDTGTAEYRFKSIEGLLCYYEPLDYEDGGIGYGVISVYDPKDGLSLIYRAYDGVCALARFLGYRRLDYMPFDHEGHHATGYEYYSNGQWWDEFEDDAA